MPAYSRILSLFMLLVLVLGCSTGAMRSSIGAVDDGPRLTPQEALRTVGFGSCLHQEDEQPILDAVLERDFDLFLFLGDNVYGDAEDPSDLAELRQAYSLQLESERFRDLTRRVPALAVWDDHDFGFNDAGASFPGREASERLFERFWNVSPEAPSARRPGIYDAHLIGPPGRRVQILLLDTRFFRSDLQRTTETDRGRYAPDTDPSKTMLGAAQWRWLEAELRKPADVRLLVSSIQILAEGHGWEAWRTLPRERERLYEVIEKTGAGGLIALTGDRHRAGIYRRDDVIPYPFLEITSSSLNRPSDSPEEPGPHRLGPSYRPENFGAVHVDWDAGTVKLEIADIDGETVLSQEIDIESLHPNRSEGPS